MNPKNTFYALTASLLAMLPTPGAAILFDCELNADKTYTCIEISATDSPASNEDQATYGEEYSGYVEQAKQSCQYEEPRVRAGGKSIGGPQLTEARKAARKAYDDCIKDGARELWREHNRP